MVSELKGYSTPQGLRLRTDNSGVQGQFGVSHVVLVWIGQSCIVHCRALGEMQRKPTDGRERCDRNQNRRAWIEKEGGRGESSLARKTRFWIQPAQGGAATRSISDIHGPQLVRSKACGWWNPKSGEPQAAPCGASLLY